MSARPVAQPRPTDGQVVDLVKELRDRAAFAYVAAHAAWCDDPTPATEAVRLRALDRIARLNSALRPTK